eukprot:COSAG05_NODE_686_length_7932_cov_3.338823_4_plen_79_part_00
MRAAPFSMAVALSQQQENATSSRRIDIIITRLRAAERLAGASEARGQAPGGGRAGWLAIWLAAAYGIWLACWLAVSYT